MEKQFLPVIAGPTASGKTALAIALAKAHGGEIISADSMQIYRELHIATARPLPEEWAGVPHHLLGFQPLAKPFSVAEYTRLAHAAIAETAARGRQPILCGGTGLYIRAVTENLQFADEPQGDRAVRARLRERAEREGGATLLAELAAIDPETAARLHENVGTHCACFGAVHRHGTHADRAKPPLAGGSLALSRAYARARRARPQLAV